MQFSQCLPKHPLLPLFIPFDCNHCITILTHSSRCSSLIHSLSCSPVHQPASLYSDCVVVVVKHHFYVLSIYAFFFFFHYLFVCVFVEFHKLQCNLLKWTCLITLSYYRRIYSASLPPLALVVCLSVMNIISLLVLVLSWLICLWACLHTLHVWCVNWKHLKSLGLIEIFCLAKTIISQPEASITLL